MPPPSTQSSRDSQVTELSVPAPPTRPCLRPDLFAIFVYVLVIGAFAAELLLIAGLN